jgi:hypothetical protein
MSMACFNCGKEIGDYASGSIKLTLCPECKAIDGSSFYRAAINPGKLLCNILMHHEYEDIIGLENDCGATRIYVGSQQAIDQGVVLMHYIRSEEVPFTDELKKRIGWGPKGAVL